MTAARCTGVLAAAVPPSGSVRRWLGGLTWALAVSAALLVGTPAKAQSEASVALSMVPLASVVGGAALSGAAAGAVVALPAALSVGGAVLTVVAVDVSVRGTVYVLERASDGARVSIEVGARGAQASAHTVGRVVVCSVVTTGVILSTAGEVLAYVPNALGRALLHNERVL